MSDNEYADINAFELKKYMEENNESNYTIVDVRQPEEYKQEHIPGSKLIALPTLVSGAGTLPATGNLIFMCHSGIRSRTAAIIAESEVQKGQKIYNLTEGILGWYGKTLPGIPKVQLLSDSDDFDEIMFSAMDLEKGAWNYYKTILEKFPGTPFQDAIEYLSLAEADHAEALYHIIMRRKRDLGETGLPGFDDMFSGLKGDILEGGTPLVDAVKKLDSIETDVNVSILEFALDIEYSAFDLYKNAAQMTDDPDIKKTLNGIANGEKNHMKKLAEAFSHID